MGMFDGFVKATNDIVSDISNKYDQVCTRVTHEVGQLQANDPIRTCYNYAGRQIRYLKDEVLPAIRNRTPEFVTSIAKNAFWVVPVFALAIGHVSDSLFSTLAGATSLLNSNPDARQLSEHIATAGFVGSGLLVGVKVVQLIVTKNPSCLISIALHLFNAVKYGMIVEGRNQ